MYSATYFCPFGCPVYFIGSTEVLIKLLFTRGEMSDDRPHPVAHTRYARSWSPHQTLVWQIEHIAHTAADVSNKTRRIAENLQRPNNQTWISTKTKRDEMKFSPNAISLVIIIIITTIIIIIIIIIVTFLFHD